MLSIVAVALLALAEPTPPAADAAPPAAKTAEAPKAASKPAKPKLVCRNEAVVGSRLPTRVCMTAEDFAERKAQDREALDRAQTLQTQRSN